jgi:hypothetical protein
MKPFRKEEEFFKDFGELRPECALTINKGTVAVFTVEELYQAVKDRLLAEVKAEGALAELELSKEMSE